MSDDVKGIILFLLYPLWMPLLIVLGVGALLALATFILGPIWWTQCQVFKFIADQPFTWGCF